MNPQSPTAVPNQDRDRPQPSGPFADVPVAPLAAGVIAHSRWSGATPDRGPFADWKARHA